MYASCSSGLASMGIDQRTFFWALTCVRSRSFAGPHFPSPIKYKLALFGVLQALVAVQALMQAFSASAAMGASGEAGWLLLAVAELAAVAAPAAWVASDISSAQLATEYVICPFIDFLNHSSQSQSECQFDWLRDSYRVVSDRPYRPGQQVLINYGSQSNDQLLQTYGFVDPGNRDDR